MASSSSPAAGLPDSGDSGEAFGESFDTHDNGGRPFRVTVFRRRASGRRVAIPPEASEEGGLRGDGVVEETETEIERVEVAVYRGQNGAEDDYESPAAVVLRRPARVLVGRDPKDERYAGNSMLVETAVPGRYVFIGCSVYEFSLPPDGPAPAISALVSPVGNSDVPYPYATDEQGQFYILDMESCSVMRLHDREALSAQELADPWELFWSSNAQVPKDVRQLGCEVLVARQ